MMDLINGQSVAPPMRPTMIWLPKFWNITCRHQVESKIIIFEVIFMILWLHMCAHPIYCHFELPIGHMRHPKFSLNSENQWFLVTTFNVIVNNPDMQYKYHFFTAKQVRHKIYHKLMIQHGGAYGGALCKRRFASKAYFYAKIENF